MYQNYRVWCRRFKSEQKIKDERTYNDVIERIGMAGSVLKAPLALCLRTLGFSREESLAGGEVMADALRHDGSTPFNILTRLERMGIKGETANALASRIADGMAARNREKSRPNIHNALRAHMHREMRGRQVNR